MKIDTNQLRELAQSVQSMRNGNLFMHSSSLNQRHQCIQSYLSKLDSYLSTSAALYESLESDIKNKVPLISHSSTTSNKSYFKHKKTNQSHFSNYNNINYYDLLTKGSGTSTIYRSIQYTMVESSISAHRKYANASLRMNVGDISAYGKVQAKVWKDKELKPDVEINAEVSGSVLSANAKAYLGNSYVHANLSAKGTVGTVYAKAKAVYNENEQTLDIGVGAAALRGEVQTSFNILGASVTISGSGSIGSAEANWTYHHANREWEFGSKLGFIAGLGFKVRVNY